jgi:predicted enzyme related to lactoylglutathione lyase
MFNDVKIQEGIKMQETSVPIKTNVNNVFIQVSNLKKSAEWYCRLLGLEIDLEKVESPVFNVPVNGPTGLTLDDHTFDPKFTLQPSAQALFNFYAEDINAAFSHVQKLNAKIVKEIERIGDFAYFNFEDLDKNVLMICNC